MNLLPLLFAANGSLHLINQGAWPMAYIGHAYIGHAYIGHAYIGLAYIGHAYIGLWLI